MSPDQTSPPSATGRFRTLDDFEKFALALLLSGVVLFLWGSILDPPVSLNAWVVEHAQDWAPGLVVDGLLLWVVNTILRRHERERVLSQVGSLSREFALDAVRRAREEGWLTGGALRGRALPRAALAGADLASADLVGSDLSMSDLTGSFLMYADLRGTSLLGAELVGADLRWADLRGANLRWCDLRGALLDGARVDGVDARFASVDPGVGGDTAFAGAVEGGLLDPSEIVEIRRTFEVFLAAGPDAWEGFYHRLFEAAPHLQPMFRMEPGQQARKLVQSLKVILAGLGSPQEYVGVLQRLGERHRGYGVEDEHYALVGTALLDTLEDAVGADFTAASRSAWDRAYRLMATLMKGEAEGDLSEADGAAARERTRGAPTRPTPRSGPAAAGAHTP
jgi:nitric oxide dioxygenase